MNQPWGGTRLEPELFESSLDIVRSSVKWRPSLDRVLFKDLHWFYLSLKPNPNLPHGKNLTQLYRLFLAWQAKVYVLFSTTSPGRVFEPELKLAPLPDQPGSESSCWASAARGILVKKWADKNNRWKVLRHNALQWHVTVGERSKLSRFA